MYCPLNGSNGSTGVVESMIVVPVSNGHALYVRNPPSMINSATSANANRLYSLILSGLLVSFAISLLRILLRAILFLLL